MTGRAARWWTHAYATELTATSRVGSRSCLPDRLSFRSQWKNKKQIDSISGAKTQALQDAIEANM